MTAKGLPAVHWDVNGDVAPAKTGTETLSLPEGVDFSSSTSEFKVQFNGSLGIVYNIRSRALLLVLLASGVQHAFVQGFNVAKVRAVGGSPHSSSAAHFA